MMDQIPSELELKAHALKVFGAPKSFPYAEAHVIYMEEHPESAALLSGYRSDWTDRVVQLRQAARERAARLDRR